MKDFFVTSCCIARHRHSGFLTAAQKNFITLTAFIILLLSTTAMNNEIVIRNAKEDEHDYIGHLMVKVYSQLEGFPKKANSPVTIKCC
jgi:hypothetical protein